jgi:hypothetical protein
VIDERNRIRVASRVLARTKEARDADGGGKTRVSLRRALDERKEVDMVRDPSELCQTVDEGRNVVGYVTLLCLMHHCVSNVSRTMKVSS